LDTIRNSNGDLILYLPEQELRELKKITKLLTDCVVSDIIDEELTTIKTKNPVYSSDPRLDDFWQTFVEFRSIINY